MPLLERSTLIPAPLSRVFPFFADPGNLALITPPGMGFRIVSAPDRPIRGGDRIEYRIRILGVPLRWVTHITFVEEGRGFADEQERGPYRSWLHTHTFEETPAGVLMRDRVQYQMPLGPLGTLAHALYVGRQLRRIFDYRAQVIREIFGAASP